MKKTFVIGASVALGVALVASVALALGPGFGPGFGPWSVQGFGPGAGPGFGPHFGAPAFGVPPIPNLTSEQSAKIQALRDGFLKDIEPLQRELFQKQTELRSLWSAKNPDKAAIEAKQKQIDSLRSRLQEKATNLTLEIRQMLTPEQLAQLPAFNQGVGFGPGPGFGPGAFGPMMGHGPRMGMRGRFGRR